MSIKNAFFYAAIGVGFVACQSDDNDCCPDPVEDEIRFEHLSTIAAGGTTEISAFDPISKKLFTVNPDLNGVMVYDLTDPTKPVEEIMIDVMYEVPSNSDIKTFTVTADLVRKKCNVAEIIKLPTIQTETKANEDIA